MVGRIWTVRDCVADAHIALPARHRDGRPDSRRGNDWRLLRQRRRRDSSATGNIWGKYRKHHIPPAPGFWESSISVQATSCMSCVRDGSGQSWVYICYNCTFLARDRPESVRDCRRFIRVSVEVFGTRRTVPRVFRRAINRVGIEAPGHSEASHGESYFVVLVVASSPRQPRPGRARRRRFHSATTSSSWSRLPSARRRPRGSQK